MDFENLNIRNNKTWVFTANDSEIWKLFLGETSDSILSREDNTQQFRIKKVIFSGPATIVFWDDGDKTVVKCMDGDQMNYEMGIAMCTLKKIFGSSYPAFKKHMKEVMDGVGMVVGSEEKSDIFAQRFSEALDNAGVTVTGVTVNRLFSDNLCSEVIEEVKNGSKGQSEET